MATITRCDRCGGETRESPKDWVEIWTRERYFDQPAEPLTRPRDLCPPCALAFLDWLGVSFTHAVGK